MQAIDNCSLSWTREPAIKTLPRRAKGGADSLDGRGLERPSMRRQHLSLAGARRIATELAGMKS